MGYQPGDTVRLSSAFTVGVTPTDPTTVVLTYRAPSGTTTTLTYLTDAAVVKDGTGVYHADIVASTAGIWSWRWVGTGAAAGVDEGSFSVEPSQITTPGLCTLDDVKRYRRGLPDSLDQLIEALIPRASAAIATHTGRQFWKDTAATVRVFETGIGADLAIDDLAAAPTVVAVYDYLGALTSTLTVATDVVTRPFNPGTGRPITSLTLRPVYSSLYSSGSTVSVTGFWGWPAVPEDVREAAITTVVEWLKESQGLTPQTADPFEPGVPPVRGLPTRARDLLRPFLIIGVA